MKLKNNILFVTLVLVPSIARGVFISNAADAGRLGDNLICYIKARYLAYKYNIPFKLNPFLYSNKFNLDGISLPYKKIINESELKHSMSHKIHMVSYYCRLDEWPGRHIVLFNFNPILANINFIEEIRKQISLKIPVVVTIPNNTINIAVHVRRPQFIKDLHFPGTHLYAPDRVVYNPIELKFFPIKFLPDQYYIDQIKYIAGLFPENKINVYIFTNYKNPKELCVLYGKHIPSVSFIPITECYSVGNPTELVDNRPLPWGTIKESGVAQELIIMSQFDYLIRSHSNYAQVADFIGKHKMVIYPNRAVWGKDDLNRKCLVVADVFIKTRTEGSGVNIEIKENI